MDLPWGSAIANCFITNVGLVTSNGIHGNNIMACEWMHHLSYKPGLIGVSVHPRHATHDHIKTSGEFGICIASIHQSVLSSIAGKESGKIYNKIKIAEALGFKFFSAKNINVLMVEDASANIECKLFSEISLGDHTLFVGEAIAGNSYSEEKPFAYHQGKYWKMASTLEKSSAGVTDKIKMLFESYKK